LTGGFHFPVLVVSNLAERLGTLSSDTDLRRERMPSKPSTSKANPMSYSGTVKRALSSADISSVPVSVNAETGSFTVVMVTGTPCRNMIEHLESTHAQPSYLRPRL
jgi:hypothetical protein